MAELDDTAVRGWRIAQTQLFGALSGVPDAYEPAVLLVGAVMSRLRETTTTPADLAAAATGIDGVVADVARESGTDLGPLQQLVGPAALATRWDELRYGNPAAESVPT